MKIKCVALLAMLVFGAARAEAQNGFGLLLASTPPGLALQFRPCLEDDQVDKAVRTLRRSLRDPVTLAEPDVRATCVAAGGGGIQTIGVWLNPLPLDLPWSAVLRRVQDAARNRGLRSVMMLGVNESFAWSASRGFFSTLRDRTWESMPHQIDVDGDADEDGPITLRRISYSLIAPDAIRTTVYGTYEEIVDVGIDDLVLDFDFRLRQTDTISIDDLGKLRIESESDLHVDTGMLDWLIGLIVVHFPPIGMDAEQWLDAAEGGAIDLGSATFGSLIVAAAPDKIMLEGELGLKLDYEHWRFEVAETEVTGGGGVNLVRRDPVVTISGPRSANVSTRTVSFRYSMVPDDLRSTGDEPLQIEWTADGVVSDPTAWVTDIEFEVPVDVGPGEETEKAVRVQVTDADGLEAVRAITLRIRYDPGGRPPICSKKPWLPECRPGIDRN
jgi:hypothetical protein